MKNNIKLSQKPAVKIYTLHSLAGGTFLLLSFLLISYFFLGKQSKVLASDGDGTCGVIIDSGETGYTADFQPYQIKIEAEILRIIPSTTNCTDGYNFNIEVAYNISFEGPGTPNINTLQGNILCDADTLWFNFPDNVRNEGGSGTFVTTVNPYRKASDCNTVTPESLGCTRITISIDGEGIPAQSNLACPVNTLLPISLVDFNAQGVEDGILLKWTTSSELNNDFFTVERSSDGKTFETISSIKGAGNSNQILEYKFLDNNPVTGYNFYRLKQTDFDGQFEYFKMVLVNNSDGLFTTTNDFDPIDFHKVSPNPFVDEINLNFDSEREGPLNVTIHNARGEIVFSETLLSNSGSNSHKLTGIDHFQSGIYFIKVQSGDHIFKPFRLIKL